MRIAIIVEGGVVQAVLSDDLDLDVTVIDRDGDEHAAPGGGRALIYRLPVEPPGDIDLDKL